MSTVTGMAQIYPSFVSLEQGKRRLAEAGNSFFGAEAMRWHNSRLLSFFGAGRVFITSEINPFYRDGVRVYTVREFSFGPGSADWGSLTVELVSELGEFADRKSAIAFAEAYCAEILKGERA